MTAAIRVAAAADWGGVCDLLTEARLPLAGLSESLAHFLVAEEGGRVVAAAGLELYGDTALLRSVVVAPLQRGSGLGKVLTGSVLVMALERGVRHVFLLTDSAEAFFRQQGFEAIDRRDVPPGIRGSVEFSVACPASAVVMRRTTQSP